MNNKVVIGTIVVLVVIAAVFLLSKNSSLYAPSKTQQVNTVTPVAKEENLVTLTQNGFSPSTFTIKAGATVTWTNKSGGSAILNSNPHPTHTAYPPLNLGSFPNGGTLSLTFDKPGSYGYHNHLNPGQTGTIAVQ